jgi:deoxycytidylate deaminase
VTANKCGPIRLVQRIKSLFAARVTMSVDSCLILLCLAMPASICEQMVFQACIFLVHIDMEYNQVAYMGFAKEQCILKKNEVDPEKSYN